MANNSSCLKRYVACGILPFLFLSATLSSALMDSSPPPIAPGGPEARLVDGSLKGRRALQRGDVSTGTFSDSTENQSTDAWAKLARAASASMWVPVLSATKDDALANDVDGDTKADPGDTLMYTVTISNTGPDPATNVVRRYVSDHR
jgi:hypothetical protein